VAQNIRSAAYKGRRGGVKGVNGGLRLTFRHNGTSCVPKELSMAPKLHYKGIVGRLITVMDDWEQPHTNATLLKLTMHCHSFFQSYTGP